MKKYNQRFMLFVVTLLFICGGCTGTDTPMVSLGMNDTYYLPRMKTLFLSPAYTGAEYRWSITTRSGNDSLVCTDKSYYFLAQNEGAYPVTFEIIDSKTPYKFSFIIHVVHETVEYSPYINKVYEYRPAPGQFVNVMPLYEEGDTEADMCKKATQAISGKNEGMVSLGAYGGYLTFGFDHTVINVKGKKDFIIFGNAFYSDEPMNNNEKGGSSEPGIVMVAYDWNRNGEPDEEEWYELAGSEYYKPTTLKEYRIKYKRPDPNRNPVPDDSGTLTDLNYIEWTDSRNATGYVAKNMYHEQEYYPKWVKEDELIFSGTLLPQNGVDVSGFGSYYVLYSYPWGYVDNQPNAETELNSFDISWAVDGNGNPIYLPGADFIRIYTGVNQYCGRLGETSTEIIRAQDLHIPDSQKASDK